MRRFFLLILLLGSFVCKSQVEDRALGVRLGIVQGLTYQQYFTEKISVEGLLAFYRYDPALFVFGQYHFSKFVNEEHLNFMFGVGLHGMSVEAYKNVDWFPDVLDQQNRYFISGLNFQLGINYDFTEFPLNLCLEFRPAFNVVSHVGYWYGIALSVRYKF